jgi:transposase
MGYSIDFREKVMEFLEKGNSIRHASKIFGISTFSVNKWKQKLKSTGSLKDRPRRSTVKKLDPEKLKAYVVSHPEAYLSEIGEAFNCSTSSVFSALKRLKITRKKKPRDSKSKERSM